MITMKEFMEVVDYRITEGSRYCWECFGPDAYSLDSWNGDFDGHSLSITFDTKTHTVYMAEAFDYTRNRAYRLINPEFASAHKEEAQRRDVEYAQAWDDVKFVDLEVDEDWMEKAQAIVAGNDYDTRVKVPIDFTDEELLQFMMLAHERDITFNQLVEEALKSAIEQAKKEIV